MSGEMTEHTETAGFETPPSWRSRWTNRRRLPLRVTLVASMLALVAVALVVIGVAGSTLLQRYLLDRVDNQLRTSATTVIDRGMNDPTDSTDRFGVLPAGGYYNSYTDDSGGFLRNPRIAYPADGPSPPLPKLPTITAAFAAKHAGHGFNVGSVSGSRHWRVLVLALPDGSGNVTVALGLDDVNNTVNRLIDIDLVVSAIVLALLAGLGYIVVRGSLRRLVEVERTAEAIAAGDLSRRVAVADDHTEVGRLGTSLNTMLGQIEGAFRAQERSEQNARTSEERMRRFIADAGHELRTPLTSVRGFAELYRLGAVTDEADLSRVMKRIEDEASRMGLLVEDLLLLARLDQQRPLERKPVELLAIATDAVTDLHALHPERPVRLLTDPVGEPPVVIGDEGRLRQVLGNLLGNAVTHTPQQTPVRVRVAAEGPFAVLEIGDDGPGMRPEDTARAFERFFRADPSRVRSSGGSGLGLSIVAALVAAHGGTVDARSAVGVGTTFTVRIPLAGAERPTAPPVPVGSHPGPTA
jgi:two-component system OmpR family sensor kinase